METFAAPKRLVQNHRFKAQRRILLLDLENTKIDAPIANIVHRFNTLPYAFTLQSCYGHFLYPSQKNPRNVEALPLNKDNERVEYRIAYLAFCIENSADGRALLKALEGLGSIDPDNIHFGSPTWFWERQVNSYALQVEPERFKLQDRALLDYEEALQIEKTRNRFFAQIAMLLNQTDN